MTPDTLSIDRTFRGVGRLKKATGTTNPAMRRKLSRMLTDLYDDGRLDILRAIRDNVPGCSLMEVWDAYQRKTLGKLPVGETAAALVTAFTAWLDGLRIPDDYSADHVRTMGTTKNYLATVKGATVQDLPRVLETLRDTVGKEYPRSFNLTRAHALAFVRATLKRSHPLWTAVSAVEMRKVVAKQKRATLTPDHALNLFNDPTDPVHLIAWAMLTTGMHAKEYWGAWELLPDRVRIHGTKREGRERFVPRVLEPRRITMNRRVWEDKLREQTGRQVKPYDLRRTYAHWMEAAGIPRTRRMLYLGHGAKDVTDLYERHEVEAFLVEDGAKLRQFLGFAPLPTLRLEKAE